VEAGAEGSEEGQAGARHSELTSPRARLVSATPYLVVTAVGLWLTRMFWSPGGYVVGFDTYAYSGPNLEVTERALRQWHLPILDDLIFGGVPHLGNPSAAALYPPQLLTMVMDTNRAMGVIVAAHVVLLGFGMLVLGRRLSLTPVGATAAGVIAMAAGATLTKTVQFEQILVVAWVPLLLATIHATITSPRPCRPVAALAATTAAILLAGHPQLVYQAALLAVVATVGFVIGGDRWRRLGYVVLGASLGVVIAVPQLVAVLYATADSAITGGRDLETLRSPALSLQSEYLAQAVLGTVQNRDPAAFAAGFESIVFIGVTVAVLLVIGAVALISNNGTRPWAIALAGVAVVALMWATGPRSLLFRIAFDVVPGFDLARASARWLVIFALVAALFAGAGVDAVWRGAKRNQLAGAVIATTFVAGLVGVGILDAADRRSGAIWAVTVVAVLTLIAANTFDRRVLRASAIGLLAVASVELGLMSLHSVPQQLRTDASFTDLSTSTTDFLADADAGFTIALTDDGRDAAYQVPGLRPNANAINGVASIDGYDGGVQITQRWADALRRFQPDPPTELPLRNSLSVPVEPGPMARLGVRFVLLDLVRPAADFIPGWTGPVAADDLFEVWENPDWIGDAIAWSSAVQSGDPAAQLRSDAADVADSALVSGAAASLECTSRCAPVGVATTRPRPERIEVTTDLDRATVVSVSQQALPGWTVTIDGDRVDVVEVDGLFLGVSVPAGEHEIVFTYRSPWLVTTLVLSLAATAATIALAVGGTIQRRRVQDGGSGGR
jgi:hypothetical protein